MRRVYVGARLELKRRLANLDHVYGLDAPVVAREVARYRKALAFIGRRMEKRTV